MIKPWKVLSSKITFTDAWMTLRTDQCELGNGNVIDNYHVIDAKTWVNVIALTDDGDVVLIREYRHGIEEVTLGLPGGCAEDDDPSMAIAASREFEEETGFTCREYVATGTASANWADHSNQIHFFLGFGATPTGKQALDPNEEIEVLTQPYAEFYTYDFPGAKHTHHAAALFYAERYFAQNPERRPG